MVETPSKSAPRLFLIDAYALIYRSFFAFINRPLTNSKGENTSAPWGFVNFLLRIREEFEPDYLAVVFDSGMSQREELYPDYKATREKMPDELRASLPRIEQILEAFHDPVVKVEGYEADDEIGTLAEQAVAQGLEAVIVSGDKDFYQLIGPRVSLLNPGRGGPTGVAAEWVDTSNASEKFGIPPEQVVDYLALIGDSSDNVPGAPGIGPKTAVKLLEEYGSLDEILSAAPGIKAKRARESLSEQADLVRLSRQLVTIMKDVPIDLDLDVLQVHQADHMKLVAVLAELEFRSLIERLELGAPEGAEEGGADDATYTLVTDPAQVSELVERIRSVGEVSVDTETTSTDPMRATLVGISLSLEPGEAFYLPLGHRSPSAPSLLDDSPSDDPVNLPGIHAPEMVPLKELLQDPEVRKIGQNLKYDILVLKRYGIRLTPLDDTMLMSYALDGGGGGHGMDDLAQRHLGHTCIPFKQVIAHAPGKKAADKSFAGVPIDKAAEYAAEDADVTLRLWMILKARLVAEHMVTVYETLERRLVPVIVDMEHTGIRVERSVLARLSATFAQRAAEYEDTVYELAGKQFNLGSPRQLGELLFDHLKLPGGKKTKSGQWETRANLLDDLAANPDLPEDARRLIETMLQWRQLTKLRSTYTDALPGHIHPDTGRIHTSYSLAATTTGRLASTDPNLQNIPIRTKEGREIRTAFIAEKGNKLISADYSQIELRVLAHMADIPQLRQAFDDGLDIHAMTASEMFGVPIEGMPAEVRRRAKAINFGIIYGISAFGLAIQLSIPREEAGAYIKTYFERFPGIKDYMERTKKFAKDNGFVETIFGRKVHYPDINTKNPSARGFYERAAINAPIQGSAADIIRRAMIRMPKALAEAGLDDVRMLLQVHDELNFEVPEKNVDKTLALVRDVMEGATEPVLKLAVPLKVDAAAADNWDDAH